MLYLMLRKQTLVKDGIYHVMNKSIAGYQIFNTPKDYERMRQMLRYFSFNASLPKFSQFLQLQEVKASGFDQFLTGIAEGTDQHVQIIAYCLMPTHIHIVLKQLTERGTSLFMGNVLNSYARFFNVKHRRQGPLWAGRFKNVLVETDEQLLHLTRYVHLNPVSAGLAVSASDWQYSSFHLYVSSEPNTHVLCMYKEIIGMSSQEYEEFVNSHATEQRDLAIIKKLILD